MKKKKVLSFLTAIAMTVSSLLQGSTAFAETITQPEPEDIVESSVTAEDMELKSTNSLGAILSKDISEEQTELLQGNGCNVFSVEMSERTASVSFQTTEDCTLIVGIYDDAGETLLGTGYAEVTADQTETEVEIQITEMPEYFYIKGYLVDSFTYAPLSMVYDCPNYTKEMQEFFQKTVTDFPEERVINFDEDTTNNFGVYSEDVILISHQEGYNNVTSADDTNCIYTIENADSTILALKEGDIFSYAYGENDLLVVKVGSIVIDGTTATITGADTDASEVFEFLRIEQTAGLENADITPAEGVEVVRESISEPVYVNGAPLAKSQKLETGVTLKADLNHDFTNDEIKKSRDTGNSYKKIGAETSASIKGSVSMGVEAYIKYYVVKESFFDKKTSYLEMKISFKSSIDLTVEGSGEVTIPVGLVVLPTPVPGLYIELKPSVELKFTLSGAIKGESTASVGTKCTTKDHKPKFENISEKPKFTASAKIEGTIYLGIVPEPKICLVNEKLLSVGIDGGVGVEVVGKLENQVSTDMEYDISKIEEFHACRLCVDGDINFKCNLDFSVTIFGKKYTTEYDSYLGEEVTKTEADKNSQRKGTISLIGFTKKIGDFYWSKDYDEFGFKECPHKVYRSSIIFTDVLGNPLEGVRVVFADDVTVLTSAVTFKKVIELTSDSNGTVVFWAEQGKHNFNYYLEDYKDGSDMIRISSLVEISKPRKKTVQLTPQTYSVEITVKNLDGKPIADAQLSRYDKLFDKTIDMGKTATNGTAYYSFSNDDYHFTASAEGYQSKEFDFTVNGSAKKVNVTLTPTGEEESTEPTITDTTETTEETEETTEPLGNNIIASGNCGKDGDNVTWTLDENELLTISGTGKIRDYNEINPSWWYYNTKLKYYIKHVVIEPNITHIGDGAFIGLNHLTSATIPDSVTDIGEWSFSGCTSLISIIIPDNVMNIGKGAFEGCNIASIIIPCGIKNRRKVFL